MRLTALAQVGYHYYSRNVTTRIPQIHVYHYLV